MSTKIHQLLIYIFIVVALNQAIPAMGQYTRQKIKSGLFIENKGQWNASVLYRSDLSSGQLYVEKDRFLFNFSDKNISNHHHGNTPEHVSDAQARAAVPRPTHPEENTQVKGHAYEVRFLGCTPISANKGEQAASYQNNYFKGSDQSKWARNVNSYQQVLLENIYPGTNLKCIGQETGFKYEFHLNPGMEASRIRLQYSGVDSLYLKSGELMIQTSVNTLIEQKPFSYQTINGENVEVECRFVLKDSILSFAFPRGYNKKYPLVIDPQLVFSTYSGSTSDNWGNTATYDDDGNAYMVGIVYGSGYPTRTGSYQKTYSGDSTMYGDLTLYDTDPDLGIMKFGPTGQLLYTTYLGGSLCDIPSSIIVNKQKQLVILGITGSGSNNEIYNELTLLPFPTTSNALQKKFNGGNFILPTGSNEPTYFYYGSDLFVSILSEDGSALIASTFVGGSGNDGLANISTPLAKNYCDQFRGEIALDEQDNIYLVHKTASGDIVNNAVAGYDKSFNGGTLDGYVAKLKPDLSAKIWDTYIGGNSEDAAYSLFVKPDNTLYVCGATLSQNLFGAAATGIKPTLIARDMDGFIAHISATGNSLLHSTYLGTDKYDAAFYIQSDTEGSVYVFGQTKGDYPMTAGTYGQPSTGQFIQKLNPELTTSLMSTTFGNARNQISIVPSAFTVNDCGNIMLSGWGGYVNEFPYIGGNTLNMPITSDAYQKQTDGSDFYIMVLKKDATELLYATYFGGLGEADHVDGGTSRFDKKGIIYQSVCASCYLAYNTNGNTSNFPTTAGAYSIHKKAENCNNAIFKFDLTKIEADFDVDTTKGCAPLLVTITNKSIGKNSQWDFGDGTGSDQFNPPPHRYTKSGTYVIRLIVTDLTTCIGRDTATKTITVYPLPDITIGVQDTVICKKDTIQLMRSCNPTWQYQWSPASYVMNADQCTATFFPPADKKYVVTVTDTNSCVKKDSMIIRVAEIVKGIAWDNMTECKGKPTMRYRNASTGPLSYLWTFGDGSSSSEQYPVHSYDHSGQYPITVFISNNACSDSDATPIDIKEIKIPNLITPNNDSKNDCFEIVGKYDGWSVDIYNNWGDGVFKSNNYANDFCAGNVSAGVYYYLVCAPYGECCKSWIHIIR